MLVAAVGKLKVGNGFEAGVLQGPLIDHAAVSKVEEHIQDAVSNGGRVLLGGNRHALGQTFFEPTVIANATTQMKVAKEETFGPLAPLFRFETDEEGIQMANDTEFGLAGYFYSRDIGRIWRAAEALECGMVGINTGLLYLTRSDLGGVKQSGTWPRRVPLRNRRIRGGKIPLLWRSRQIRRSEFIFLAGSGSAAPAGVHRRALVRRRERGDAWRSTTPRQARSWLRFP